MKLRLPGRQEEQPITVSRAAGSEVSLMLPTNVPVNDRDRRGGAYSKSAVEHGALRYCPPATP